MCLPLSGCNSTMVYCDEEMEFEMVPGSANGDRDSWLKVLVEIEAARGSHKWDMPAT